MSPMVPPSPSHGNYAGPLTPIHAGNAYPGATGNINSSGSGSPAVAGGPRTGAAATPAPNPNLRDHSAYHNQALPMTMECVKGICA